jgi:exopolysaccharide biosynthesis protein
MMLRRICLLWLTLLSLGTTQPALAAEKAAESGWEVIAEGIEFQKFQLPAPNNVFVVRMDRSLPSLTLESSIAQGKLSGGTETVSAMFSRYDQALNYWGGSANPPMWGMRNQVVVAINGSYYDPNTGIPQGGQVHAGWYARQYDNLGGWSGFAWKLDRNAFIGECVVHQADKQLVGYPATASSQPFSGINRPRQDGELIIYTPQYDSRTGTDSSGVEVLVEMTRPTMILPEPSYASGFVRHVGTAEGNSLIPFNSIVLSAHGTAAETLLENVQVGDEVRISQEITSYEADCQTPFPVISWTKTYASLQGAYYFLKDGLIRDFDDPGATDPKPRTAIAYNQAYVYFIVVDGRDSQHSIGMSINQLATFARDTLAATHAVAEDGGGSSTLVINGVVVNNTFCNIHVCAGELRTFLPMISRYSQGGQAMVAAEPEVVSSAAGIERAVANGMLIVVVQPGEYSAAFYPGNQVMLTTTTEVRLGPGTNYPSVTTLAEGTSGTIAEQVNDLDGVLAKGAYWWYVDFGDITGWVPEASLAHQVEKLWNMQ